MITTAITVPNGAFIAIVKHIYNFESIHNEHEPAIFSRVDNYSAAAYE